MQSVSRSRNAGYFIAHHRIDDARQSQDFDFVFMTLHAKPSEGHLSVADVVARLRTRFLVVDVDEPEGLLYVTRRIMQAHAGATHDQLESLIAPLSEAALVIVADDPKSDRLFMRTFVIPGEPIIVDWDDRKHARRCEELLNRYAAALNYQPSVADRV